MSEDKTQPDRQRRYRAKLYAERDRVPELEAEIARLKTKLAKLRMPKTKSKVASKRKETKK
jgi:hypothetical protein